MKLNFNEKGMITYNKELHPNQGQPWSEEDLLYLIEWYDIIGGEEMSFALGRTEKTISVKASNLRKEGLMKASNKQKRVRREISE